MRESYELGAFLHSIVARRASYAILVALKHPSMAPGLYAHVPEHIKDEIEYEQTILWFDCRNALRQAKQYF